MPAQIHSTTRLTDFIRVLVYDAMYRETLGHNPDMLVVPMAIDAGVGSLPETAGSYRLNTGRHAHQGR